MTFRCCSAGVKLHHFWDRLRASHRGSECKQLHTSTHLIVLNLRRVECSVVLVEGTDRLLVKVIHESGQYSDINNVWYFPYVLPGRVTDTESVSVILKVF
jgi:hypothetical protein